MPRTRRTPRPGLVALLVCLIAGLLSPALATAAEAPPPPPSNNHFHNAMVVTDYPYDETSDTRSATMEPSELSPCGGIGGTVWHKVTATYTGRMTFRTTGIATTIDTVLAVYRGAPDASLGDIELLDCNDDEELLTTQSEIVLPVVDGQTYYLQAGGKDARRGSIRVQIRPAIGFPKGPDSPPDPELQPEPGGPVQTSVVLDNGRLRLGVNDTGNLVARDHNVGLEFKQTGNDALNPGCPCEGWGIVDEASGVHAGVSESGWPTRTGDLRLQPFEVTLPDQARSTVLVGDDMKVTHKFRPALGHPNLFEIVVEVTNLGETDMLPLYRRTMDWDIGPTEFREYVTIAGDVGGSRGTEPKVIYTSNDGFAMPDPTYGRSNLGLEGTFTDQGPDDHGALVDIALPKLQAKQSSRFSIFYGAAGRADEMKTELVTAQAAVYSLAKPSSPGGLELGDPNTFGFGFRLHDSRYVALGDSFQSGEGAPPYESGTDVTGVNECHRSLEAYPRRLAREPDVGGRLSFRACSGAIIVDLKDRDGNPDTAPWNEDAQLDHLGGDTTLVTLGIGGNDMKFANILKTCIKSWALQKLGAPPCSQTQAELNATLLREISDREGDGLSRLEELYREVRKRAPRARVLVFGYPRFFTPEGVDNCAGTRQVDQLWINEKVREFDAVIAAHVRAQGMEYVDMFDVGRGHELCGEGQLFMNAIDVINQEHSYHPNGFGHGLIADLALRTLRSGVAGDAKYRITPEQRIYTERNVPAGTERLDVSTSWPGSDILLSLLSPSGVIHRRGQLPPGTSHSNGPTHEAFSIADPEPGVWTVRMFGADVDDAGEPVTLRATTTAVANQPPTAAITTTVNGSTVTFDASASADSDGTLARYTWDFSDGTSATGAVVTHTYTEAGTYTPSLVVTDDEGAAGFATSEPVVVELARYGFSGFLPPVSSDEVNVVRAGRSIPFKWTLSDVEGSPENSLEAITGFRFDAPGATFSALRYDAAEQQYVLVANTPASWTGQRRTFTLTLRDGTTHRAVFDLR